MSPTRLACVLLAVLALAPGCRRRGASGIDEDKVRSRATEVLEPVKKKFEQSIAGAMKLGAEHGLERCRLDEAMIRASIVTPGTTVTWTSNRLRNRANTTPDWAKGTLDAFVENNAREGESRVFALGDGRTAYAEAIVMGESCMACHGSTLTPDVERAIDLKYAGDGARGYALGQFRGLYLVELPPEPK